MATKTAKKLKSVSPRTIGAICLVILLAATVFVSWLGITGMELEVPNELLPWIPVSSENWPASLPVTRALGGGTFVDYNYTIPEGAEATALDDSIKAIRARLDGYGENDSVVSLKDGKVHLELRDMSASRRSNIQSIITTHGHFAFSDNDTVVLTEKDITGTSIAPTYNGRGQLGGYALTLSVTPEARKTLDNNGYDSLQVTMDGSSVGYGYVTDKGIEISFANTSANYNTMTTADFLIRTGAVSAELTRADSGEVASPLNLVLTVVLWVSAALLALTLIYTVIAGKLTGISATISVWCAIVLSLFLVATVVVPTINALSVACLIAILLGIVIAMYTAVTRTDAISKQIGEGAAPKAATKLGFKVTAKSVWLIHGAVMLLALILMIFAFSRPVGYCLAAGVFASAIAVVIMRAYQACFTALSGKASLFGKVK